MIRFVYGSFLLTPSASRLMSMIAPDGSRIAYSYDNQGNLTSARDLSLGESIRYGYDRQSPNLLTLVTGSAGQGGFILDHSAGGQALPVTADLGASLDYLQNAHSGNLTAGSIERLTFSLRPSELSAAR